MESYQYTNPSSVFEENPSPMIYASTGQRFANFLIDLVVVYACTSLISFTIGSLSVDYALFVYDLMQGGGVAVLLLNLINIVFFTAIYTLIEGATKGKTLGKLITRTRAVREHDGSRIGWKEAFIRSISRFVPFEAFSGFSGHPWHDQWSHTIVAREDSLRPVH